MYKSPYLQLRKVLIITIVRIFTTMQSTLQHILQIQHPNDSSTQSKFFIPQRSATHASYHRHFRSLFKRFISATSIDRFILYGSETWAMKVEDMKRLEGAKMMVVRWMYSVTLRIKRPSFELRNRLGIESLEDVVVSGRLRWCGHVERKLDDDWID